MTEHDRISLIFGVLQHVRSAAPSGVEIEVVQVGGGGDFGFSFCAEGRRCELLQVRVFEDLQVARDVPGLPVPCFVLADTISPGAASVLVSRGISHADASGRVWVRHGGMAFEAPSGSRAARAARLSDLRGPARHRAVLALCEAPPGSTLRRLAAVEQGTGLRALSEAANHLRVCGYMRRSEELDVDVGRLLPAWASAHRDVERSKWVGVRLPALAQAGDVLEGVSRLVWSGLVAASRPGVPARRVLHAYVENLPVALDALGWDLLEAHSEWGDGDALFLREPDDRGWFARVEGASLDAPPLRVALDLLVGPDEFRSVGMAFLREHLRSRSRPR